MYDKETKKQKTIMKTNKIKQTVYLFSGSLSDSYYDEIVNSPFFTSLTLTSQYDKNLSQFLLIHRMLYKLSGAKYGSYSFKNITLHVTQILSKLYNFSPDGFVDIKNLDRNEVFAIFRTVFPFLEYHFKSDLSGNPNYLIFILQHLNNIVLLLLLNDIKLANSQIIDAETLEDSTKSDLLDMLY